jgi:hypothetical protein
LRPSQARLRPGGAGPVRPGRRVAPPKRLESPSPLQSWRWRKRQPETLAACSTRVGKRPLRPQRRFLPEGITPQSQPSLKKAARPRLATRVAARPCCCLRAPSRQDAIGSKLTSRKNIAAGRSGDPKKPEYTTGCVVAIANAVVACSARSEAMTTLPRRAVRDREGWIWPDRSRTLPTLLPAREAP